MRNFMYSKAKGIGAILASTLFLPFLFSCTGKGGGEPRCLIETEEIINVEETRLSNIIKVEKVIPLESGADCMVGDITKLVKENGMYFVESARNAILVFDSAGRFLNDIGDVGGAENEYTSISDFDVCGESVYVLSPMKIQEYSIAGKYVRTIPTQYAAASALKVLNDKFILYVLGDEHLIHVTDKEGKETAAEVESTEAMRETKAITFHPFGEELLIPVSYSNGMLAYDTAKGSIETADVTDYSDAVSVETLTKIEETGDRGMLDSYRIFDGLATTQRQLLFAGKKGAEISLYVKDAKSDKAKCYDFMKIEDDVTFGSIGSFFTGNTQAQDCFITYVDLPLMKERMEKSQAKDTPMFRQWEQLVDSCSELSNPVLIEYTMDIAE